MDPEHLIKFKAFRYPPVAIEWRIRLSLFTLISEQQVWIDVKSLRFLILMAIQDVVLIAFGMKPVIAPADRNLNKT